MSKQRFRLADMAYEAGIGGSTANDYELVFILNARCANLRSIYTQVRLLRRYLMLVCRHRLHNLRVGIGLSYRGQIDD